MISLRQFVIVTAVLFLLALGSSPCAFAAPPTDACSLLTPAQVGAVLGIPVAPGRHLSASNTTICDWGAPAGKQKGVMVTLQNPRAFAYAKMPVGNGIVKTPASGIGDDAVYGTTPGYATVLTVKKDDVVFVVHVNGFSDDEIKAKEKALALDVLAKL